MNTQEARAKAMALCAASRFPEIDLEMDEKRFEEGMARAIARQKRLARGVEHENARKGGLARAAALSPERRSEIARKAAATRWAQRDRERGE